MTLVDSIVIDEGNSHRQLNFCKLIMYKNSLVILRGLSAYFAGALRICLSAMAPAYEKVAMERSGHRTRSVFDRYDITIEQDQVEASDKLEKYLERQAEASKVVPLRKAN